MCDRVKLSPISWISEENEVFKHSSRTVGRYFMLHLRFASDKMNLVFRAEEGLGLLNTSLPAGNELRILALVKKVSSLLSFGPPFPLSPAALIIVIFFCVLIPNTVTGTLITAALRMLTGRRIGCAGVVTNIDLCSRAHRSVFSRATGRGFLCTSIKSVCEE